MYLTRRFFTIFVYNPKQNISNAFFTYTNPAGLQPVKAGPDL
jgi:hypothetical protein